MKVIAIDGPSASGKSTAARHAARHLGWFYVDSGSLYRALTWLCLQRGCVGDDAAVTAVAEAAQAEFFERDGSVCFRLEGKELVEELRTAEMDANVSLVAAVPAVRQRVNRWLHSMTSLGGLVVEGRDIGTAVFPDAAWKFYLDASAEARARRRHTERGTGDVEAVAKSLARRDKIDSSRKVDPLRMDGSAVRIDSTALGIDEVVKRVLDVIKSGPPTCPPCREPV